jgi:hypothetical protein
MNLQTFKCRASAAGKLLTNARAKTETLSETTKTYLKEWATEQIFGYKKELNNKYVERGIESEDFAIDFSIQVLDLPFAIKNETTFEDDHFTGTPDLIVGDTVYDIKCSWSAFTFPYFEAEIPNSDYYAQLQVYMHLTGKRKACLTYVLLDNELIGHTYDVDNKKRLKTFEFEYDPSVIEKLIERVQESRTYLESLI